MSEENDDGGRKPLCSGPWTLNEEETEAFYTLRERVADLDIVDRCMLSRDDFILRFLIARHYDVDVAEASCRKCMQWRQETSMDNIYHWARATMPADIVQTSHDGICGFYGYDSESYPVWWERPNQKGIEELIKTYGIDAIIMWHQYTMERIRDHMKDMGVDRFSFVIDLSGVSGMAVIMGKIGTLIKAQAKQDQEVYPEMMRKMLMINAPRGFSTVYSWIKSHLDKRIQDKIFVDGKRQSNDNLSQFISEDNIPVEFGGTAEVDWSLSLPIPSTEERIFKQLMFVKMLKHIQERKQQEEEEHKKEADTQPADQPASCPPSPLPSPTLSSPSLPSPPSMSEENDDGGRKPLCSGPWTLNEEESEAFYTLRERVADLDIVDRCMLSRDDFILRFLIARHYDVDVAEASCRKCMQWRQETSMDNIYHWARATMPADIMQTSHDGICGFYGYDIEGYPVWWERPNQKGVEELIKTYGIDSILTWHQCTMERIRDHMKDMGVDRFSSVLDLSSVSGMSVIMGKIGTLLKAQTKQDQEVYPEMMRKMFMINAPRGFSTVYSWIKSLLDKRIQDKITLDGKRRPDDNLSQFISEDNIPVEFGGTAEVDWSLSLPIPSTEERIFKAPMYVDNYEKIQRKRQEKAPKNPKTTGPDTESKVAPEGVQIDCGELLTCLTVSSVASTPQSTPAGTPRARGEVHKAAAKLSLHVRHSLTGSQLPPLNAVSTVTPGAVSPDGAITPTVTSPMPLNRDPNYSSRPALEEHKGGRESGAEGTRCRCVIA